MRAAWVALLALAAVGCKKPDPEREGPKATCSGATHRTVVVNELRFARQDPVGVGVGFDLDGRVSDASDTLGCHKPDLVSPDGTLTGIDSAFSALVPVLEATEAAAVEGLIHDAIRSGELLLVMDVGGVDDEADDDCVSAEIVRGDGVPLVGTDGNLLDHQTFERNAEIEPGQTTAAWIADGELGAEGLNMRLAIQILDEYLEFDLLNGQMRGTLHEDGSMTGSFAGGISVAQVLYEFDLDDISIADLIRNVFPAAADLADPETGSCDAISMTFEYEAIPAWLFEE